MTKTTYKVIYPLKQGCQTSFHRVTDQRWLPSKCHILLNNHFWGYCVNRRQEVNDVKTWWIQLIFHLKCSGFYGQRQLYALWDVCRCDLAHYKYKCIELNVTHQLLPKLLPDWSHYSSCCSSRYRSRCLSHCPSHCPSRWPSHGPFGCYLNQYLSRYLICCLSSGTQYFKTCPGWQVTELLLHSSVNTLRMYWRCFWCGLGWDCHTPLKLSLWVWHICSKGF